MEVGLNQNPSINQPDCIWQLIKSKNPLSFSNKPEVSVIHTFEFPFLCVQVLPPKNFYFSTFESLIPLINQAPINAPQVSIRI